MSRVLAVVQARTGSTRLPGKVLADLGGRPLLALLLARLTRLPREAVDELVVATTTDEGDDGVARVAEASGVGVVRGPRDDVLARFALALDAHPADVVVRLTADCPLVDPLVVADMVAQHRRLGAEYTSNTLVRTFPDGLDAEVVAAAALRRAAADATDPAEREHVTPFVYRRPERFRLAAYRCPEYLAEERWTVDTPDDLTRVRAIVARLDDPVRAGWRDILAAAGRQARPPAEDEVRLVPALVDPAEPAVRRWVALAGDRPVGWARVVVRSGVGQIQGAVEGLAPDALAAMVKDVLRGDLQVTRVAPAGPLAVPADG